MGGGNHSPSPSQDFHGILNVAKTGVSIKDIGKAYKNLIMRWHPQTSTLTKQNQNSTMMGAFRHQSLDNFFSPPSTSTSMAPNFLSKSSSTRTFNPNTPSLNTLSKSASRRSSVNISYSGFLSKKKVLPVEKKVECTLEELCYGCEKKINITRDVHSDNGTMIQEEELLRIKVKPGWKNGTKITFEGVGDEKPGCLPADVTFLIEEIKHQVFTRHGDDLEMQVEIPLVQALTGCYVSIPLLSGEKMNLQLNDIIQPGYEKVIAGQGMPSNKKQGRRGDLRIKFQVDFPTELTDEQRSEILGILHESP
ncbi:hypothetical protein Syun_003194 [Stephania yunnanensis]|uniref:Chaperone DnaJ C-terminal domain-containing protein n=1 Tax=Stephania yunnanensis TaxID=152371 RepID=A0AAP0PZN1_9MAGN